MPYIPPEQRQRLDPAIDALLAAIKADKPGDLAVLAGVLNYACTRLALGVIPERRYASIALVSGVLHNVADEFYRRYAVPYEDQKIKDNGDVYDAPS